MLDSKVMSGEVAQVLYSLLERSGATVPVEYDPDWPSPCIIFPPDVEGMVRWQPVPMNPPARFEDIQLHPDLQAFFGSFWGGSVEGTHSGESVLMSVAWNQEELLKIKKSTLDCLVEGVPVSIAGTSSDWYFGVDNNTGEVWLCEPGYPPIRKVSSSIAAFLNEI